MDVGKEPALGGVELMSPPFSVTPIRMTQQWGVWVSTVKTVNNKNSMLVPSFRKRGPSRGVRNGSVRSRTAI